MNFGNFMLKLIQKNNNNFVMTNMCTYVILLRLRLATNMLMNIILIMTEKRLNLTNLRIEIYPAEGPMLKAPMAPDPLMVTCLKSRTTFGDVPCRGTHAQDTGGSRPTHGELLEVADHSWCRKIYTVSSLERPPGSRQSGFEKERAPPGRR